MTLRRRLLVAVATVAAVAITVSGVVTYLAFRAFLYERLDDALRQAALPLGRDGDDEPPDRGPQQPAYVQIRAPDGSVLRTVTPQSGDGAGWTPDLPASIPTPGTTLLADGPATFFTVPSTERGGPDFRVKASTAPDGEQLIIALTTSDAEDVLRRLALLEVGVAAGALLLAALVGWVLVRRDLAPLDRLTSSVRAIDVDRGLDHVPVEDPASEVGELAVAMNGLLVRIDDAFAERAATQARLRQFVADASHELRTPVAAVSAYAQLFDLGADRRPDDLRRSMAGIVRESQRMGDLVEDLLLLARLDQDEADVAGSCDVSLVAADAVDAAGSVGPEWPVTLDAAGPAWADAPAGVVRQILDNLLSNVRAHTPPGTPARVIVSSGHGSVVLSVTDSGPGVSEEQRTHMFERFWRAQPARSRSGGGNGLGLSIVSSLARAIQADVVATDGPDGGLTITVTVPAAPLPTHTARRA